MAQLGSGRRSPHPVQEHQKDREPHQEGVAFSPAPQFPQQPPPAGGWGRRNGGTVGEVPVGGSTGTSGGGGTTPTGTTKIPPKGVRPKENKGGGRFPVPYYGAVDPAVVQQRGCGRWGGGHPPRQC